MAAEPERRILRYELPPEIEAELRRKYSGRVCPEFTCDCCLDGSLRCCGLTLCITMCLLAALLLTPTLIGPWMSRGEGVKPDSTPVFFRADMVHRFVPLSPVEYPENLEGVLWPDSSGQYGPSEVSAVTTDDFVMSFGDTRFAAIHRDTRKVYVSPTGPGWAWLNNAAAYREYSAALGVSYLFTFNEEFTQARVYQTFNFLGFNLRTLTLYQYSMKRMPSPPLGACPPQLNATKADRARCATWVRETCLLGCYGQSLGLNWAPRRYYVYQVVDSAGKPVEPYFGEAWRYAQSRWAADAAVAERYGIELGGAGLAKGTVFASAYT